MKTIIAPKHPPRLAKNVKVKFSKGYLYFLFAGGLMILMMLFTAKSFPSWGIVIFSITSLAIVVWIAFRRVQHINREINQRKTTYEQGETVTFIVVKHSRPFMWQISAKGYGIICQHPETGDSIKINRIFGKIWDFCPIGSHIDGFYYQYEDDNQKNIKHYIFGEMLDVKFQFEQYNKWKNWRITWKKIYLIYVWY